MTERPRRSAFHPNYAELADVMVPKRRRIANNGIHAVRDVVDDPLQYRLEIVEEDAENSDRVKVRYIGYSSKYDEWRTRNEIVELSENDTDDDDDEQPSMASSSRGSSTTVTPAPPYSLVLLVAQTIKDLLISSRRGSPTCSFVMPFDKVVFDSLAIRGVLAQRRRVHRQIYTIPRLSRFDDLFGERWYIRGLGDFCYVIPGSVEFYLKQRKGRADYQVQADDTLLKNIYGQCYQLTFSFIRGDGTSSQWDEILQQCKA